MSGLRIQQFISLSHFTASLPSESDIPFMHSATSRMFHDLSLPKKFVRPIHPSTGTALPPPQFAVNANTWLPNPNSKPGFDLSQTPKTRVYRRNPCLEALIWHVAWFFTSQIFHGWVGQDTCKQYLLLITENQP